MESKLRKQLGLFGLTMIAVGSCVGSGIFIVPSDIAGHLHSSLEIFAVWGLGGIVALTGALTFVDLAHSFPEAGGVYAYIREAFGKLSAFLYGWVTLTVITSGALAALSLTFARYVSSIVPMDQTGILITAVAAIIATTAFNLMGVKFSDILASGTTLIKLLGVAFIVVAGVAFGSSISGNNPTAASGQVDSTITSYALAMIGVLWSFGGWHHASYLSAEARNSRKVVPRAMVLGALIVTAMYLAANWAYMRMLPLDVMASSRAVAADSLQAVMPSGAVIITILIAFSTFGSIGIFTMSAPRIYYAMARDGDFFSFIARVHPETRIPHLAILIQSSWAIVILLFWGTFEKIISSVVFMDWVFMILATASIFIFRRKLVHTPGMYRTPGYPVVPVVFILISAWFVTYTLIGRPHQALAGIVLLLAGIPVYYLTKRAHGKGSNRK